MRAEPAWGPPLPVLSVDFILACIRAQIKYIVCHQLKEAAAHSTLVPSPLGNPPRVQSLLLQKLIIQPTQEHVFFTKVNCGWTQGGEDCTIPCWRTPTRWKGQAVFQAGARRCSFKVQGCFVDEKGKGSLWEGLFSRAGHIRFLVPECLSLFNAIPCFIIKHSFSSPRKMTCPFCQICTLQVKQFVLTYNIKC